MITLAADCLLFKMAGGESIPFSAEMISVELLGETADLFSAEFVRHASHAVFHYFKHDLGRKVVSVHEFSHALEKVLRGFVLNAKTAAAQPSAEVAESDLSQLATESGKGCELFFYPRLRAEFREQLTRAPRVLRFRGLRSCVKELAGSRRWNERCRRLEEQILDFLRECLSSESRSANVSLIVD